MKDCANKKIDVEVLPNNRTDEVKRVTLYTADSGKFNASITIPEPEIMKYAIKASPNDKTFSIRVQITSPADGVPCFFRSNKRSG